MNPIAEVITAEQIVVDWVGSGGVPVPSELSSERAYICAGCPENRGGKWWATAKHKIADVIRSHLEIKNGMQISTSFDDELNMCRICGCALPLKVHVPIQHILDHTDSETLAKFPAHCWIAKEKALTP